MNKIKIAQSEFLPTEERSTEDVHKKVAEFVRLHGQEKWDNVKRQWSQQRHGNGVMDRIESYLEEYGKDSIPDEEWEKEWQPMIEEANKNKIPKDQEAYAEIELQGYELEEHHVDRFISLYGYDRYLQASGIDPDYADATNKSILQSNPAVRTYKDRRKAQSQKKIDAAKAKQEEAQRLKEELKKEVNGQA